MLINDIKFITVALIRYQNTQPIINGAKMVHVHANMFAYVKSSMKEKITNWQFAIPSIHFAGIVVLRLL